MSILNDLFLHRKFTLIAGPCVIESEDLCMRVAGTVQVMAENLGIPYIFKASFSKANRTSGSSFRGPGIDKGLEILARVKGELGIPILTDIHEINQAEPVSQVVDIIQIPAFLSRQTDLIEAAARTKVAINIKKGQFMSPTEAIEAINKVRKFSDAVSITERGTTFGYNNLVVDMRSIALLKPYAPVIFDATHSVQYPGMGGDRTLAPVLARSGIAAGADALFCEVHPDPDHALSDGPNSLTFDLLAQTLIQTRAIREALSTC